MLALRVVGIWLLILVGAILNGGLREAVLLPHMPKAAAFLLSGLLLAALVLGASLLLVPRLGRVSAAQYWAIGICWFGLTILFELTFGLLVRGASWQQLVAAYRFEDGNIWPLVLLVIVVAPRLAGHWHHASRRG